MYVDIICINVKEVSFVFCVVFAPWLRWKLCVNVNLQWTQWTEMILLSSQVISCHRWRIFENPVDSWRCHMRQSWRSRLDYWEKMEPPRTYQRSILMRTTITSRKYCFGWNANWWVSRQTCESVCQKWNKITVSFNWNMNFSFCHLKKIPACEERKETRRYS